MANIEIVHETDEKHAKLNKMLLDLFEWAFKNHQHDRANFLLVAKDIPEEETAFARALQVLRERAYKVFLAVPDDIPLDQVQSRRTASIVWRWTMLFDSNFPIKELDSDYKSDSYSDEGSSQGEDKRQKITDDAASHK
ncbi:unnamed protein product [Arabidopsis arenosa]|uniref:NYN domain-containing protein n=1 Tax=Arabidopsis arenosa TaxID=38785 RepID=A0A8S1ZGI0_ARAAE|nr:unnamed protein product [Arabidopsis arenosa]